MSQRGFILFALVGTTACLDPRVYPCSDNGQCIFEGRPGVCEPPGYCAYEDGSCPSGMRFGPTADAFANDCVPPGGVAGSGSESAATGESSSGSEATTTDPMSCNTGCMNPPGPCFQSPGTCDLDTDTCEYAPKALGDPCTPDDPCQGPGTCNGAGQCEGTPIDCLDPGPCEATPGTCNAVSGMCEYEPLGAGSPCEDGNDCTIDDACDGAATCVGGETCSTDNPCETGVCQAGACVFTPIADGMSCGPRAADRCCSGSCIDIASDDAHCGGCGLACDPSQSCESVGDTSTCDPSPADTTGRCTCAAANAQCPGGQICRTATPFDNRCAPDAAGDCPGTFVDVANCPNYCAY